MRIETKTKGEIADSAENSCETRRAILDAAKSRFIHYGYKKTTIDEIALAAKVGKGTVYLYFDGKEDILLTLVRQVKRNITDQMRAIAQSIAAPEEKIRRMVLAIVMSVHDASTAHAHGTELVAEMMEPRLMRCGADEREAQMTLLAQVLREGEAGGDFEIWGGNPDKAARFLMMAMASFFPPYMNPCHEAVTCRGDLEGRANAMLDFLMHGVCRSDKR